MSPPRSGMRPLAFVVLAAWCGTVAGLLEVGAVFLRKYAVAADRFYGMSRHFVWLVPLTNVLLFVLIGLVCAAVLAWNVPAARWLLARSLCALTLLPCLLASAPQVSFVGWFTISMGVAVWLVPVLNSCSALFTRTVRATFVPLIGVIALLAGSVYGTDWVKSRREASRALPSAGAQNVLLIVLDTVRADHLSLYGYGRRTSATLEEIAARGTRFDRAVATASWTLPSHASMFTGRLPHELSTSWTTPLDGAWPTVAERMSSLGYSTAGFVGNTRYCAYDSGLARGFTTYRDYTLGQLECFGMAELVDRWLWFLNWLEKLRREWEGFETVPPAEGTLLKLFRMESRKDATHVSREFLDWWSQRSQPERPFFVFLNYFDAHYPYEVSPSGFQRFGSRPRDPRAWELIKYWQTIDKRFLTNEAIVEAVDGYDSCVADLDEQFGRLWDELDRRRVLDSTWVIITSDHGESFGEHGVFKHGQSLYQSEIHVPLVVVPPRASKLELPRVVSQTVSLRDLPATILDMTGQSADPAFPGQTLGRFWNASSARPSSGRAVAEVSPTALIRPNDSQAPVPTDHIASLVEDEWKYIQYASGKPEELFNLSADPKELHNASDDAAARPRVTRMRNEIQSLKAAPSSRTGVSR